MVINKQKVYKRHIGLLSHYISPWGVYGTVSILRWESPFGKFVTDSYYFVLALLFNFEKELILMLSQS